MAETAQATAMNQAPVAPEGFIEKSEVARRLNKTVRTVENWMARGILPYYKLGRTVAFRWSEIEAHLKANYRVCSRPAGRLPRSGFLSPGAVPFP